MKFNLQKIANPYMLFGVAWMLCLLLYVLGWSELFPKLSDKLLIFLICAIFIFLVSGFLYGKINYAFIPAPDFKFGYKKLLLFNYFFFSLNFLPGGIPLLQGSRNWEFGIPTVVVIATTLNSFCSVYCFYLYLIKKEKKMFIYIAICLLMFALAYSRGYIMMSGITMFFLWMNVKRPVLTFKKIILITSGILFVLYLFGVAGNYRVIGDISATSANFDKTYNSDVILNIGEATTSFRNKPIPGEFFWTYLYITSPLSNLQYNTTIHSPAFTLNGLLYLIIDEFLFDTVSKRIDTSLNRERGSPDLIVQQLTVPTTFANSYDYAGWIGMIIFLIIFWSVPFLYTLLVINNPFGIIGISTLCTIFFLSIFDNMLILTGLSFQLLYPIIMFLSGRITFNKKDNSNILLNRA